MWFGESVRPKSFLVPSAVLAAALFAGSPGAIADDGPDHQVYQRPSPLGVSVSSIEFLTINGSLYCYAGTAGALVEDQADPSLVYVLSNNHVLARENDASIGEAMIQPGLLDENGDPTTCSAPGTNYDGLVFGHLSNFVPLNLKALPFGKANNTVDAAIAEIDPDTFVGTGDVLDIGEIDPNTASATVGMAVRKSGRTSGFTTGAVAAVDVSIAVQYANGYGLFKNQIRVTGDGGPFIVAGDSGSLMVTGANPPRAVGLLFAGSDTDAFANPIDTVLGDLGVSMLGCSTNPDCAPSTGGGGGGGGGKGGGKGGGNGGGRPTGNAGGPTGLELASQIKASHEDELFRIPGVVGTGISVDDRGNPVIEVYVASRARRAVNNPIPDSLEGVPVRVVETGTVRAF